MDLEQKEQKIRIDKRDLIDEANDFEEGFDESESNQNELSSSESKEQSIASQGIPGRLPILPLPDLFSQSNKKAFRIRWQITNSKKVIILN